MAELRVKKSDRSVKDAAILFQGLSYADVLNKMWRLGYKVENLAPALAQDAKGTNDVSDIITRLVNSGIDLNEIKSAAAIEIEPTLKAPFYVRDAKTPIVPGKEYTHTTLAPSRNARDMPGAVPGSSSVLSAEQLAAQNRGTTPAASGAGGATGNQTIKAPPITPEVPMTQEQIRAEVRKKYGGYAALLDDPAFGEIQAKLELGAKEGWDEATTRAQIQSTAWWQSRGETAGEWDVMVKANAGEANARIVSTSDEIRLNAKRLGVTISEARVLQLATEAQRSGLSKDPNKINNMVAAEAEYVEEFTGEIGAWETGIKAQARNFLTKISDKDAFAMAKRIGMGELSPDAIPEHFRTLAKAAMPTFAAQIDQGATPRELLASHTQTIADLLEVDPETIDYLGDSRLTGVISHADEKGNLRPMTLTETSKHIKGLDDYWKTRGAGKEVSSIIQNLGRSFGKIA